jgi:hypothetical protein
MKSLEKLIHNAADCYVLVKRIAMIHCNELSNKVVRLLTIYEDGAYGPEVHIEFTDGTTFSACLKTNVSIEAKYIHDQGGEPSILRDYTADTTLR